MDHLQTEARNPASTHLDELSALEIVRLMNAEDGKIIPAVASQAEVIAKAIDVITDRLRAGGRLVYAGAGTSGRLGVLDATECPPTFNSPPSQVVGVIAGGLPALTRAVEGAEDHPEFAEQDLQALQFSAQDVLVGIATSGRTPYVLGALAYAKNLGAFTVGLSCNADSALIPVVDLAITPVVGPEVLSGSTRLKAGTATKLVLNMLTTGAMVRLGKSFGNLMVDLRATNEKLKARTNRIVRQLTGLNAEQAAALLQRCGGELKTALVVQQTGLEPDEARARLHADGGQVRRALHGKVASKPTTADHTDLVFGIDGGGTHTVALLADRQGKVVGRGVAGPSNLQAVGLERATHALDEAVGRAFVAAGRTRSPVTTACLGLSGAGRPEDQALIRDWAQRVGLAATVEVTGDAEMLLIAGTPDGWGIAVIAGTGSMAFARGPDGRTARAGGWGYLIGDEGSGYALALGALRAVAQAADGRGLQTALTSYLLKKWNLKEAQELIAVVYRGGADRVALAAIAPLVLEAAKWGDTIAGHLVERAAADLASAVLAAAEQLGLDEQRIPLALAGGLLTSSVRYQELLLAALDEVGLQVGPVTVVKEPAEGAVRRALAGRS